MRNKVEQSPWDVANLEQSLLTFVLSLFLMKLSKSCLLDFDEMVFSMFKKILCVKMFHSRWLAGPIKANNHHQSRLIGLSLIKAVK